MRKLWGIFLYFLLGVFTIVLLLFVFINIPPGKKVVRNRVQSYLQEKLHTKVIIGRVDYSLPEWINIKNVYIEDQHKDTLLYGEELSADLSMFKLLQGNTHIQKLYFKNIIINIHRGPDDSVFNYLFVVNAFTGNKSTTAIPDTAALKLTLDRLIFDNVALRFKDEYGGSDFVARIKSLDATLDKFQPDRVQFGINDFNASGVDFFMSTYRESVKDSLMNISPVSVTASPYGLLITSKHFNLRDVNVTIDNKVNGMYYANRVTHLGITNALFNLDQGIAIGDTLSLDSSFVQFKQPKTIFTKENPDTVRNPWLIEVKQLALVKNQVQYDDVNLPKSGGLDFAHFDATELNGDVSSFHYSYDSTKAIVNQFSFKEKNGFQLDTLHVNYTQTNRILSAKELYVKTPQSRLQNSIEIIYDSLAGLVARPQNSIVSAVFNNSVLAFNDLYQVMPSLKSSFPPAQFANNSIHINTELRGNLERVYLPYLQLSGLSGSSINAHGNLYHLTDARKFSYDLYIDGSSIAKTDIFKFISPANREAVRKLPAVFKLSGHIVGNRNDIAADIKTNAPGILFNGKIALKNITNPAKLEYDLNIANSDIDRNFILGFVPAESLPSQISIPQNIKASGKIKGNRNNVTTDVKLNTSYGIATIKGYIKNTGNPSASVYDLYITTPGFNIGKLLKQDTVLGMVSGNATAKGTGFDYQTMQSVIRTDISSLQLYDYTYHNALINADFNRGSVKSDGNINDSSLQLNYNLTASNLANKYPSVNAFIDVDTAQLQKLHLSDEMINFSTVAKIKADNLQPRNLDINALLDSTRLQLKEGFFLLDTVALLATSSNATDDINFRAPFANLHANGAFDYDKVGNEILQYINHYYKLAPAVKNKTAVPQQISFEGSLMKHPIVTALVPGLYDYDNINLKGSFASAYGDSALNFTASAPYLHYMDYKIRNGNASISSRNERINYAVTFDTLHYIQNTFYGTTVNGSAAHDSLSIEALTQDNKKKDWFGIHAGLFINGETYTFRLKDNLLLNYENWNVAPDNYISYSPQGYIVNNFSMSSDTAKIFINSRQQVPNSPIDVTIDNFNLKSISSILSNDTIFTTGIMDAKLTITDLDKKIPGFTGNAQITDLVLMQQPLGNVSITTEKTSGNEVKGTVSLVGNGNDISAKGTYYLDNKEQQFDADLVIRKLNFKTIEGFSMGKIKNAGGNISGNLNLQGKFSDPRWTGVLNFDTTQFTLTKYGAPYKMINQHISLDYPDITFKSFILKDSLNHEMVIDGTVTSRSLYNYDLNLDMNAVDFIILNSPKAINNEIYGYASVDANVAITGNTASPNIEGNVFVNDKSDITIVLPETSYNKDDAKTVVRFIDRDTFNINPPSILFEPEKEPEFNFARYLNYNFNIEVNKSSAFTIIVDPATGDKINVKGDAQLNAGVDPGGNIILSGNYELEEGYYELNYQFLQRKFNLIKGSQITFVGEPMNATINITAEYIANTSARDLLYNEVGDVSSNLRNSFNQKIPFKVMLYLTGILSRPTINFDILLPEESNLLSSDLRTTIEGKLAQIRGDATAMNKQVFSLLLLNRFVGEQSSDFFKGNGTDFTDLAKQSVSQFMSSALNEIAANLFKGLDVDLNLNTYRDFSNGGNQARTDLNVAISKTFLDDRLTISVGTNFGIEGHDPSAKVSGTNTSFMPDITISYKLTKDGKYMVRAYRRNQFEVVLDGYVVETGLAFIVTMDYDKFTELFRRKK
ncbi:MAG TPA: translocation/assembly module TamB domain-containing protein [Ferruginibacter sp.]|nr:translocation/assembly module TamB domain-containing protein [Ferruginibacter sp.]